MWMDCWLYQGLRGSPPDLVYTRFDTTSQDTRYHISPGSGGSSCGRVPPLPVENADAAKDRHRRSLLLQCQVLTDEVEPQPDEVPGVNTGETAGAERRDHYLRLRPDDDLVDNDVAPVRIEDGGVQLGMP